MLSDSKQALIGVRAPRDDWMSGSDPTRTGRLESLSFGLSIVYMVILVIVLVTYVGGG